MVPWRTASSALYRLKELLHDSEVYPKYQVKLGLRFLFLVRALPTIFYGIINILLFSILAICLTIITTIFAKNQLGTGRKWTTFTQVHYEIDLKKARTLIKKNSIHDFGYFQFNINRNKSDSIVKKFRFMPINILNRNLIEKKFQIHFQFNPIEPIGNF